MFKHVHWFSPDNACQICGMPRHDYIGITSALGSKSSDAAVPRKVRCSGRDCQTWIYALPDKTVCGACLDRPRVKALRKEERAKTPAEPRTPEERSHYVAWQSPPKS